MRLSGWKITGFTFLAVIAMCVTVFLRMGFNELAVRLLVRDTARVSVTLFILAFTASSLYALVRSAPTRWLLQNRRYIGVAFAVAHGVHFAMLGILFYAFPHPFREYLGAVTLIGGGTAYLFILLMTATSFDRTAALIGPRAWGVLHKVGAYYIWVLFAQSYIPRAVRDPWYIPFAGLVVAGLLVRIAAWMTVRTKQRSRVVPEGA
ncbi:MAG: hypothetical protein IT366_13545 [Candidatus Hydrogenedentes bacterium]|nr:hypothetical protein [Candidatus Hydrogenedentota bacterium]